MVQNLDWNTDMLGDSSSAATPTVGASPMGGASSFAPSPTAGMPSPGPGGNQQSFNFNQMGGIMPNSGSRHFGMRRNPLRPTQPSRYNLQAPKGLADTQGLQAMQAKLGLDLSHNARAKAALHKTSHATKVAVMPPIAANQDNSALGMSMGVPPMNPAQPMGAPPPQSMPPQGGMPAPMPPGGMPPQQGGMPMPQDPSMQGAGAMGGTPPDPNAMPMAAPGGPPGSMPPPAPTDPNAPPMPGDQPPAVQNSGNLVSGLAAQQESMDENDPAAAAEEIGIEAAPGLATGMPKLGAERETPGYAKPLPMAATAVGLSGAGLLVSRYGKSLLKQRDAIRKLWESRMNQETAKRFGRVPTTPDAARFDRAFKRPDAGLPLPPRDAEATRAYGAILQLPAAMVGARALYDSSRTPSTPQVASNLGLKNGTFAAPEFKGKKMIRDPYIEKLDKLKKMGSISDFAHSFMTRCAEKNVNFKEAAIKFAKDFGFSDACVELSTAMLVAGEREKQADAWGAHSPQAAAVGMTMGMAPSHSYNRPAATTQTAAAPMPKNPPISTVPMAQPRRMTSPGMKTGSCLGSEAKSKKKPGYFTTQSKKTAGLWDMGRKAMGWAMGKAPGMANKAQGAASAAGKFVHPQPNPGAWQNWMSGMTPQAPAGVNRTWSDFGKSMFQGGPQGPASYAKNTPWSNLGNRVMGAAQGAMAGSAVEGRGEDSTGLGMYGGMALGAMTGTGSRGNLGFKGMGALQRPMQQAFLGGAVGLGGDMVSNTFGGPSLGLETAGARLGLGAGLLGNAARSHRQWANKNHMLPAGWANFADDAASGIKATYDGGMAPFTWAGNWLRGASNKVFGTKMPMSDIVPQGLSPRNRALFGAGGLATGIPLAGTGIGIAANAIQHPIREAARGAVEDGLSRANEWAQQRGLMGEDGRFHAAGVGAATVDRMIQGLGMDPSQMSQADKWSLLGGGMLGGLGVATGNPMLAAGGLGAMGYGGRNGLMELLGHAARFSTGKNTNQLVQNAMTPGDVRMNGQGW